MILTSSFSQPQSRSRCGRAYGRSIPTAAVLILLQASFDEGAEDNWALDRESVEGESVEGDDLYDDEAQAEDMAPARSLIRNNWEMPTNDAEAGPAADISVLYTVF